MTESSAMPAGPHQRMCPSTPKENATVFLGSITPSRRVAYVTPAVPVTPALMMALDDGPGTVESRYRLAGPCVEGGCGFWTGASCALAARIVELPYDGTGDGERSPREALPRCAIRARCRWYAEQGAAACTRCSYVVTDARSEPPVVPSASMRGSRQPTSA